MDNFFCNFGDSHWSLTVWKTFISRVSKFFNWNSQKENIHVVYNMCVCLFAYIYICTHVYIPICTLRIYFVAHVCVHVYMPVCIYVISEYIYICRCTCVCIHVEAGGWCHCLSSWLLSTSYNQGRVSCWIRSSLFKLVWLARLLKRFSIFTFQN